MSRLRAVVHGKRDTGLDGKGAKTSSSPARLTKETGDKIGLGAKPVSVSTLKLMFWFEKLTFF